MARIEPDATCLDMFPSSWRGVRAGIAAMPGDFIGKQISLQVETSYHQEQYDVILM